MGLKHRTFTTDFKKQLIEQILYRSIPVGQISREHNIARQVLYRWVRDYQRGELKAAPGRPSSQKARIEDLESLVGRLMIDNELLKKALQEVQKQQNSNEIISGATEIPLEP